MDFLTHILWGAGCGRLLTERPAARPPLVLAAALAALLPDADSFAGLGGLDVYGRYHRLATHSIVGLLGISLVAATMAWWILRWRWARRAAWFLTADGPPRLEWVALPWRALVTAAMIGAGLHLVLDAITGYGNLHPFWPWGGPEISLRAVFSFDPVLFAGTLGWYLALRQQA